MKRKGATSTIGVVILILLAAIAITIIASFVFDLTNLYDSEPEPDISFNQEYERISDDTYRVQVLSEDLSNVEYAVVTTTSENAIYEVSRYKELSSYDDIPQNAAQTRVLEDGADGAIIASEGDQIVISGLKEGDQVQIYSANEDGEEVFSTDFTVESLRGNEIDFNESSEPYDGDGSYFSVQIDSTNDPVDEREEITVNSTITNTGNVSDSQLIQLRDPYGQVVDSVAVSLGAGNSTRAILNWSTQIGDAGERVIAVGSLNDSDSASVEIERANIISDPMIMTVDSTKGVTGNAEFRMYTGGSESYTIRGENVVDGEQDCQGDCLVQFNSPGVHQIEIHTRDPFHYQAGDESTSILSDTSDEAKSVISIDKWGEIEWSSFEGAFAGTTNMNINAEDAPDLIRVDDMSYAFSNAKSLNTDLDNWDVSNVKNMESLFQGASNFNGDISGWDTSNVIGMRAMFYGAESFNQDIGAWDTSSVTNIENMFYNAQSFNQDLNSWDTSSVDSLQRTFGQATNFNGDISGWDTSNVESLRYTFLEADSFNQDLNSWDTSNVETLVGTFQGTANFNGDIRSWDVSNVETMSFTFNQADDFNQDISGWEVTNVEHMNSMFYQASSFNRDISPWCVPKIDSEPMDFDQSSGFEGETDLHPQWGSNCNSPLIMTIDTTLGDSPSDSFTIYMENNAVYNVSSPSMVSGTRECIGECTVQFNSEGQHKIKIQDREPIHYTASGSVNGNSENNEAKSIISIDSWGDVEWSNFEGAFAGATNMNITASDTPDISSVTSMDYAFSGATNLDSDLDNWDTSSVETMRFTFEDAQNFNGDISSWDTSSVIESQGMFYNAQSFNRNINTWQTSSFTSTREMFFGASSFNQDLNAWDTRNIQDMSLMFGGATSFNGEIGDWNTENLQDMRGIFRNAESFNQDISNWNVENVQNLEAAFLGASNFNQDIGLWDVSNIQNMNETFSAAESFNQDISNWNVENVENMDSMFYQASDFNQDISNWCVPKIPDKPDRFDIGSGIEGETARHPKWDECNTPTDPNSEFIMEVDTTQSGVSNSNEFIIKTGLGDNYVNLDATDFDYTVEWSDGYVENVSGDYTVQWNSPGIYEVKISGDFPHIKYAGSLESLKITDIKQWGDIEWKSFDGAFAGASTMQISASDNPDLSEVRSTDSMFRGANNFDSDIGSWNTESIRDMRLMFYNAENFNNEGSFMNWDVSNVQNMDGMFYNANSFNQDIGFWDTSSVKSMKYMFHSADNFNRDISLWDTRNVVDMSGIFQDADSFNSDITSWNTSNVINMSQSFANADNFNQDIGFWDVSNVQNMNKMFDDADGFNGYIGSWNTSNVKTMNYTFRGASNFNQDIADWNTRNVQYMKEMFKGATKFDQDISTWCVPKIHSKPIEFDSGAGFDGQTSKQPEWGICDSRILYDHGNYEDSWSVQVNNKGYFEKRSDHMFMQNSCANPENPNDPCGDFLGIQYDSNIDASRYDQVRIKWSSKLGLNPSGTKTIISAFTFNETERIFSKDLNNTVYKDDYHTEYSEAPIVDKTYDLSSVNKVAAPRLWTSVQCNDCAAIAYNTSIYYVELIDKD